MIYLDYAATTPIDPKVANRMVEVMTNEFANPSASYQAGKHLKYKINQGRKQILDQLGFQGGEIYFTSGATEANNWAIMSQAYQARQLGYGHHLVAAAIEHPSVLETLSYLEGKGFEVTLIDPEPDGRYRAETFIKASRPDTSGWISMAVNNETGQILPIESINQAARQYVQWHHVDAVQALGKLDFPLGQMGASSYAISGHKIYGPKGIGALIYTPFEADMTLFSFIHGGGQEKGKRSGTENTLGILALVEAVKLMGPKDQQRLLELNKYLHQALERAKIDYEVNGQETVPNIVNLYLPKLVASQILIQMDLAGIAISAGSACSAGSLQVSHVLQALYPKEDRRHQASIRISFGRTTQESDFDAFIEILKRMQERE